MRVNWQAYPKQIKFFNTTEKEVLYGGAAGGGKSIGQVMDAFIKAAQYPGMAQLILRSTYEELEKSILRDVEVMYPASVWKYNKSSHTGRIGKSIIDFGYLASDKDLKRYQSAHYDIIRFDELTHFTEYQYTYMMSRVRGDNNFPKQIKSTTNPGSVGHAWVKKRFVTAAEPNQTFSVNGRTRIFIPAKVQDNLFLMKSDPEYIEWLEQLPEHQKQALLYGNWDIFEGQYFTEYSYQTHVIPRDRIEIPKDWKRFRSMDWGFKDPCCVLWYAIAPSGRVVVYDELYVRFQPDKAIAAKILEKTRDDNVSYTVASPDMFKEDGKSSIDGPTLAEIFANNGVPLLRANNTRIPGWQRVREYLAPMEDNHPRLLICSNCVNLIRTLPEMVYDEYNVEDIADGLEDHASEALRYGLMSRPSPNVFLPKPEPKPFDPFARKPSRGSGFYS